MLAIYRRGSHHSRSGQLILRRATSRSALHYVSSMQQHALWSRGGTRDLLGGIPTARIVELPGANLYMFLSNEADVLREMRAFAVTLTDR